MLRGQIDISARVIWVFEKFGWVRDVKWPDPVRLAAKRRDAVRGNLTGSGPTLLRPGDLHAQVARAVAAGGGSPARPGQP